MNSETRPPKVDDEFVEIDIDIPSNIIKEMRDIEDYARGLKMKERNLQEQYTTLAEVEHKIWDNIANILNLDLFTNIYRFNTKTKKIYVRSLKSYEK